jgi:hypothetical protein
MSGTAIPVRGFGQSPGRRKCVGLGETHGIEPMGMVGRAGDEVVAEMSL